MARNVCPECVQSKCGNCDGTAWHDERDEVVVCDCYDAEHEEPKPGRIPAASTPSSPEFDHTAALRALWRELAEKRIESGADWPYIARTLFRDLDDAARTIDDLRSRLGCVAEASYWDRPYDTRLDAIRGMCDLTTNGMTPASEMSTPPAGGEG